jgi:nicotinamide-nucleotide amidase
MRGAILTIGSEILSGAVADTNAAWLTGRLGEEGLDVVARLTLGDDPQAIEDGVRTWLRRVDLLVLTGGLGATPDDRTRPSVARALGRTLVLHEPSAASIRRKLSGRGAASADESPALLPMGAEALSNPVGLAPGFLVEDGESCLLAVPGVPAEMRGILDEHLGRILERWADRPRLQWRSLHTCGVPETRVAQLVAPHIPAPIRVSYLPRCGIVEIRLGIASSSPEPSAELAAAAAAAGEALGDAVFGWDGETLEEVVGRLLVRSSKTLGVAESLTGGRVGSAITAVPGSSRYFLGGVVAYGNRAKEDLLGVPADLLKRHGAVSSRVARSMAEGARRVFGVDVGLSTTGIAGPAGGTEDKPVGLVYFAVAEEGRTVAVRRTFRGERGMIVERSTATALDLLRRSLSGRLDEDVESGGPATGIDLA